MNQATEHHMTRVDGYTAIEIIFQQLEVLVRNFNLIPGDVRRTIAESMVNEAAVAAFGPRERTLLADISSYLLSIPLAPEEVH